MNIDPFGDYEEKRESQNHMKTRQSKSPVVYFSVVFLATAAFVMHAVFAGAEANNIPINPGVTIDGLRMEARAQLVKDSDGNKLLVTRAYLINEGAHEATVLTKGLGTSMSRDANGLVIGFDFAGRQKHEGRLIIPSLSPHEPVTLRTGEIALLTTRHTAKGFVETLKQGDKIRVGYLVTNEWGERLGLWHGYVCVEVSIEVPPSE